MGVFLFYATAVFSTYVEVIPFFLLIFLISVCVLHVCGGDPVYVGLNFHLCTCSPRMWR